MGTGNGEFCQAWKEVYDLVKDIDPSARVAGPNLADYNYWEMDTFMKFVSENNCVPDIMTWHELYQSDGDFMYTWEKHLADYKRLEEKYNIGPLKIVINEYAKFHDNGTPGHLIQWIARFENSKVYACLPYWYLANSLNELAADANKPNGAWWLYKWYADMSGNTVPTEIYNTEGDNLYGLASIDDDKERAYVLFGGEEGASSIVLTGLNETRTFGGESTAHLKLYSTKFTGFYGHFDKPYVEFDGDVPITNGTLNLTIPDADKLDAYYAIISPATGKASSYEKIWTKTYEAEAANLVGCTTQQIQGENTSNGYYVKGLSSPSSKVTFNVNVPQDGKYKLEIYYGNEAPLTQVVEGKAPQNRAQGKLAKQLLKVDGETHSIRTYASTIKSHYFGCDTVYIDLTAGNHNLELSKHSGVDATLDKIQLTYEGQIGEEETYNYRFEAEEAQYSSSFTLHNTKSGYHSAGYLHGTGEIIFPVVVKENGYYDVILEYAAQTSATPTLSKKVVTYAPDAKKESAINTKWNVLDNYSLTASSSLVESKPLKVYLTAGINLLKLNSIQNIDLDGIQVNYAKTANKTQIIVIEAEDGNLFGTAKIMANENVSNGQLVGEIGANRENGMSINVNVKEAGDYKLSIDYINNEPAPPIVTSEHPNGYIHPYNTDLVERYAQISVNGDTPQTVYFINTLSWDSTRNIVVDIVLEEGDNIITFYNDNSYKFSNVTQYAPNFDKFEIAKAKIDNPVDKTLLLELIEQVRMLEQEKYTEKSWISMQEVLQEAQLVLDREKASQNEIDITHQKLLQAKNSLVLKVNDSSGGSSSNSSGSSSIPQKSTSPITLEQFIAQVQNRSEKEKKQFKTVVLDNVPYTLPEGMKITTIQSEKLGKEELALINKDISVLDKLNIRLQANVATIAIKQQGVRGFTDLKPTHWAKGSIDRLMKKGIVYGYEDGSFKPESPLSLTEAFVFLDRVLVSNNSIDMKLPRSTVEKYITNKDSWSFYSTASISSKLEEKLLKQISSTMESNITRELLAQVLFEITNGKLEKVKPSMTFKDNESILYKEAVDYCQQTGLIAGLPDGTMEPKRGLTRAELMSVLERLDNLLVVKEKDK
ncbi:hypothetical protein CS063_14750 [Sporanaerobium hydrogeniformans]|uniref:Uncharacterized protein n=1 Tax=Sporanaerobium hydrogeniformans TaxID=3072179 RepID=A0AC61D7U3_9FIRM|nr:S-layer homology domain-containing protein [Sporanaerobium hydrogeniformans]PHV69619.1 hypothetical protein CS063_14750 [Sporanaerobium hydrogeniformans]